MSLRLEFTYYDSDDQPHEAAVFFEPPEPDIGIYGWTIGEVNIDPFELSESGSFEEAAWQRFYEHWDGIRAAKEEAAKARAEARR